MRVESRTTPGGGAKSIASIGKPEQPGAGMLVLARTEGQRVLIGSDVEVVVLEHSGSKVRLGIRAPRALSVRRAELETRP